MKESWAGPAETKESWAETKESWAGPAGERNLRAPGMERALERTLRAPGTERALERTLRAPGTERTMLRTWVCQLLTPTPVVDPQAWWPSWLTAWCRLPPPRHPQ